MVDVFDQTKELRRLWSNFQSARVLLTANNYRVFNYLNKRMSASQLAVKLKTDKRATAILLDALTGLDLLKKIKKSYMNTSMASRLLVTGTEFYQGDIIKHADTLWKNWSGLDTVLKTGIPYHKSQNHRAFILGMHNLSVIKAKKIVQAIGLKGVKKALDLGGGPGTYTMEFAKRGINTNLFDTPEAIKIAKKVSKNGFLENIHFVGGDFFSDDVGDGYDLVFISQIFHSYNEKKNLVLLKKCNKAMTTNGRIVIQDFFIDDRRTHPVQSALFAVNMLVNTDGGRCYSPGEIKKWLIKTGFKKIRKKLIAESILISAHK